MHPSCGPSAAHALTARPDAGFSRADPDLLETSAGGADLVVAVAADLHGRTVRPGTELRWVFLPEGSADVESRWDATSFAVTIRFDDGMSLTDLAMVDQYGDRPDPQSQAAARKIWPDQWNLRRVDLSGAASRVIERVEAQLTASPRTNLRVWLDQVTLGEVPPDPRPGLGSVVTTRGSQSSDRFSRGNCVPVPLLESDQAVTSVARRCGYPEVRTFSTAFRRHFGQTSTEFRRHGVTRHLTPAVREAGE